MFSWHQVHSPPELVGEVEGLQQGVHVAGGALVLESDVTRVLLGVPATRGEGERQEVYTHPPTPHPHIYIHTYIHLTHSHVYTHPPTPPTHTSAYIHTYIHLTHSHVYTHPPTPPTHTSTYIHTYTLHTHTHHLSCLWCSLNSMWRISNDMGLQCNAVSHNKTLFWIKNLLK